MIKQDHIQKHKHSHYQKKETQTFSYYSSNSSNQLSLLGNSVDSDSEQESRLVSLVTQLAYRNRNFSSESDSDWDEDSKLISLIVQTTAVVNSMDLDSHPERELTSLISKTISVFSSMDLDSQPEVLLGLISCIKRAISLFKSLDLYSEPESLWKLQSLITQESSLLNYLNSDGDFRSPYGQTLSLLPKLNLDRHFVVLFGDTLALKPVPEFMSLIQQIFFLIFNYMNKLISLSPQVQVRFEQGKFHVTEKVNFCEGENKWRCLPFSWDQYRLTGKDETHFLCVNCEGENHGKAPVAIRHPLHPKHLLQFARCEDGKTRECYCCDEKLERLFFYCPACDCAINTTCLEKPPVLSIDHPKWHEHTLAHFPRHATLTCDMCALVDPSSTPIYTCLTCDFVVHQRCLSLPHAIRISRHCHRISFTPSFDQGDWFCGVCRTKIDNAYGGYTCIKESCSYVAHSKCATRRSVWDGKELEGEPEEIEEVLEPFVRISDGIIQHFSHQLHHLKLEEDTHKVYDENKMCQACITPIYFGNFYSCMQCNYILHETCANLFRKINHPIHPHPLILVGGYDGVAEFDESFCSACGRMCKSGFFYECGKYICGFKLDVQCATTSEPLFHKSHPHPLFLTFKPGERRTCGPCNVSRRHTNETFNCIECDFSLCYGCATLPQKVRYKHDKHMLTLSYGEEECTMSYWCEVCEKEVNPKQRFYKCEEYCCVTLHIDCLIGEDLYMKPGSSHCLIGKKVGILPNNHHMSRPICSSCKIRCPFKVAFQCSGLLFCSLRCTDLGIWSMEWTT